MFFWTGRSSAAPASATAGLALGEACCIASPPTGAASATGDALRAGADISKNGGASAPCRATGELGWGWGAAAAGRGAGAALGVRLSLRDLPAEALFCFAAWSSRLHCEHRSDGSFLQRRHRSCQPSLSMVQVEGQDRLCGPARGGGGEAASAILATWRTLSTAYAQRCCPMRANSALGQREPVSAGEYIACQVFRKDEGASAGGQSTLPKQWCSSEGQPGGRMR